ncbi:MAG: PH domain-containing protein [Candidatus Parabeggiatoa sp. nov. 1]|nr:MAG: PH domain-containing protein [Gammaproteobacteria bacterium]
MTCIHVQLVYEGENLVSEEKVLYNSVPSMFGNRPFLFIFFVIAVPIGWIAIIVWWIQVINTRLIVTNESVTLKTGILSKNICELWLSDIRSVQINQRFLQRFFGTGTVELSCSGTDKTEIKIDGIPQAYEVEKIICGYRHQ